MNLAPFVIRPDIMGIVYSVKSIIIIAYQLLTEHTRRFARWKSLKANFILNCIEPVFWLTLIVLKFMGISSLCSGSSCAVAWISMLLVMVMFTIHAAASTGTQAQNAGKPSTRVRSGIVNRRSHAKSRTGCRTCKRRRIKCDESRPSCRNCEKHAVTCDFATSNAPSASPAVSSPQDSLPASQLQGSIASSCDINLLDLELMHNFTTYTCTTIIGDPAVRQLLRTTAVHMAVNCEYLMRSILAVSALHLSRYRPQKKDLYLQRAMHHHQAASSAAIELLTDLRAEECERLHLFSMLTVYYALGCPVNEGDLAPGGLLIPHWLRLLHGMEPILHMLNPKEYRGVLTPLFDFGRSRMQPFLKTTPPRDPSLLVDVQSLIHRTCNNPDLIPIYDDMIEQLRRILGLILTPSRGAMGAAHVHSHSQNSQEGSGVAQSAVPESSTSATAAVAAPPSWIKLEAWDILVWQWTQGKHFRPLLDVASPPQEAVVIFAYCLLVLRKLESQWYVEGWADHLMGKTWALLDEEHRHWVVWATEEMGWIPPR
ncbi:sterol uptake control protein 2 [Achaetomium macrosporum]|uniref:Sterol uptake control protein 2 n=1 Tax=Achaetomium macrosporum TaxID=79813 RepID=A0AAN7HCE6_9PEZI|nr:sterol uptake control protein 2 [Achaetomium macrosporum]